MNKTIIFEIIHDGNAEPRYADKHIVVEFANDDLGDVDVESALQRMLDKWCEDNPDRLDQFGSAERDFPIDEVAQLINDFGQDHPHISAKVVDTPVRSLFL